LDFPGQSLINPVQYANNFEIYHDIGLVASITTLYGLFLFLLNLKFTTGQAHSLQPAQNNEAQRVQRSVRCLDSFNTLLSAAVLLQIFLQVFLISLVNAATAALWTALALGYFPEIAGYGSVLTWFMTHAAPPYIYLTLNKTIRREAGIVGMFRRVVGASSENSATGICGGGTGAGSNSNVGTCHSVSPS